MARMKFVPQQGMVLFAKNKSRVSAFYRETLGLRAVESEPSHDLLQGHTYEIVVHLIPRKIAACMTVAKPPTPRTHGAIKPTFVVKDARWFMDTIPRAIKIDSSNPMPNNSL